MERCGGCVDLFMLLRVVRSDAKPGRGGAQPLNLFAWIDPSSGPRAHKDSLMDGQAHGRRTTQSSLKLPAGQLGKNEPAGARVRDGRRV